MFNNSNIWKSDKWPSIGFCCKQQKKEQYKLSKAKNGNLKELYRKNIIMLNGISVGESKCYPQND